MMKRKKLLPLILISHLTFLCACSSSSLEDFREEGEIIKKNLIQEFKEVQTKEDLALHANKLETLFLELSDIMIRAQEFKKTHPNERFAQKDSELTEQLREEMNRILSIDGTRDLIEKIQAPSLKKLEYSN